MNSNPEVPGTVIEVTNHLTTLPMGKLFPHFHSLALFCLDLDFMPEEPRVCFPLWLVPFVQHCVYETLPWCCIFILVVGLCSSTPLWVDTESYSLEPYTQNLDYSSLCLLVSLAGVSDGHMCRGRWLGCR